METEDAGARRDLCGRFSSSTRDRSSEAIMIAHFIPAMFQPLLAEMAGTARAPTSSATVANEMKTATWCVSGACTSSETTSPSYRAASIASSARVSRSCGSPSGLCELQSSRVGFQERRVSHRSSWSFSKFGS
jgi:hypothetical protein